MHQLDLFGQSNDLHKKKEEGSVNQIEKYTSDSEILNLCVEPNLALEATILDKKEEIVKEAEIETIKLTVIKKSDNGSKKNGRKSFTEMSADLNLTEIPEDEILFQKQYYSITEVAGWFKVNTSLLRFWENEFDILKPRKNKKGDRLFRPKDIKNLQIIYYLLRHQKFTIEGAREYLKNNSKKAELNIQVIQSLTNLRSFLLELKANLEL